MAYAAPFHRIVIIGNLYADTFNTTLTMMSAGGGTIPAATQELADDVRATVAAWWPGLVNASPGSGISLIAAAQLVSVKVNRIGTDGRYMDAEAIESTGAPVSGGGGATIAPAQLSIASTLRGADPRARAGKGRMYFPPTIQTVSLLGTDGRLTAERAEMHANGIVTLIQNLNDAYLTAGVTAVAGIASKAGTGAFQAVTEVTVGRVVDTMRSRRNKLNEEFVSVAI